MTKAGGTRPTNLRDARKLGLFPSVTGIISILAKPGLEKWKLKQVALAAFNTKKRKNETEESRLDRALNSAFAQVDVASDFGTQVHRVIEEAFKKGTPIPDGELLLPTGKTASYHTVIAPVMAFHTPLTVTESEIRLVNKTHGFAGTMDEAFTYGKSGIGALDYKTRRTTEGQKVVSYPGQAMQIAAYGATYWAQKLNIPENEAAKRMLGANLFISSTEPGRFDVIKYKGDQLELEWAAFILCLALWRWMKGYDPRKVQQIPKPQEETRSHLSDTDSPEHDNPVIVTEEQPDTSDVQDILNRKSPRTLGFGKYKDTPLQEVPESYLRRYVLNSEKFSSDKVLIAAVEGAIGRQKGEVS